MKFDIKEEDLIIKPYKQDQNIYVREQKGRFQQYRRVLNWVLMLTFILVPFIPYQGQQAVLFDVANQQFRLFSLTLWPQDFMLVAGLFMAGAFALFFVTNWLGRVWCGYVCPQTVWTLMFIWVEHKIEGTRNQRIKLDNSALSNKKALKKTIKHTIWLIMSILTATTFMSYFVPVYQLYGDLILWQSSGLIVFWVFLFALCTYGNAGWLREKMCIYMCPYSRFQSVMFDKDTLLVTYDSQRGENRGPRKRSDDPKSKNLGDCVDCNLCVEVCPAGIDIRNGLQYECINCGLCIDACNQTMTKFGYAKNLIQYTSENNSNGQPTNPWRLKLVGYAVFTLAIFVIMAIWLAVRVPLEVSVLRDRNTLYRMNFEGLIENPYTLTISNKTQQLQRFTIEASGIEQAQLHGPKTVSVLPGVMQKVPVTLVADGYDLSQKVTDITFTVTALDDASLSLSKTSKFYKN